jgi:hypothetical protein
LRRDGVALPPDLVALPIKGMEHCPTTAVIEAMTTIKSAPLKQRGPWRVGATYGHTRAPRYTGARCPNPSCGRCAPTNGMRSPS